MRMIIIWYYSNLSELSCSQGAGMQGIRWLPPRTDMLEHLMVRCANIKNVHLFLTALLARLYLNYFILSRKRGCY